jgi:PAS domain-containing protein
VLRSLVFKEKAIATRDGRWFTVRIMPYRTLDNRIDGVVITFVDITAAKTLEATLRGTQDGGERMKEAGEHPGRRRERCAQRAEDRLKAKSSGSEAAGHDTAEDSQRLVHELQVHQIELELQNEELQESRAELEVAAKIHADLYDFAPMGYLTLDGDGVIRKVNLTGARLLGLERSRLVGARLACLFPLRVATASVCCSGKS